MVENQEITSEDEKPREKITIKLTEELSTNMDKYPEVKWSEVARQAFRDYLKSRQVDILAILKDQFLQTLSPVSHQRALSESGLLAENFRKGVDTLIETQKIIKFRAGHGQIFFYCTAELKPECEGCNKRKDCRIDEIIKD